MKMSEYGLDEESSPSQQQFGVDAATHNLSTDDPTNAANNSIIGKVKSRVSSILPNRLSKWFSPSTKLRNDELNGSISANANTSRRRRRIEVDDDDEEDDENCNLQRSRYGEYEENHNVRAKQDENSEADDDDEEDDDESQNSEEEYNATLAAQKTRHNVYGRQPPAKRSRVQVDMRDSPMIAPRRPLVASTPAVASSAYTRNSVGTSIISRPNYQRYTHLNLYGGKKEPAYNFNLQKETDSPKINTDIIDLISQPPNEDKYESSQSNIYSRSGISSRRSLNIPSTSATRSGADRVLATVSHLKRQSLATVKSDIESPSSGIPPRRTSTTIHEVKDFAETGELYGDEDHNEHTLNGQMNTEQDKESSCKRAKRQNHINGSVVNDQTVIPEENEAILLDTASESSESGMAELSKSKHERKTGLYNTSITGTGTTRNSSRTSSFGNGLNFYSHLEGKKSLFNSGSGHGLSNQLNNSTLSLTSLNRRQFNASIYGSTSALSDSRLLNTFSPFYKGKTTYGGAAAYNKYTAGAGASAVRITPTLIRPTSSLSTLSSSNNSLSTVGMPNSQQIGESSTISSTAKRILDLINDFATPLSEAKKMANTIKTNSQLPPHAKSRLNDSDLNVSRAMRLSQVRTPYARPSVILQPSGNANIAGRGGSSMLSGPMPPIKELQVPTMSQLLQMKKIQNTTERARKITRDSAPANAELAEYTLPVVTAAAKTSGIPKLSHPSGDDVGSFSEKQQQIQQKHTNKIKNKVTTTMRASAASKDIHDEAPPPSLNLPNIAFPLMQSVPKFDIQFSSSSTPTSVSSTNSGGSGINSKSLVTKPIHTAFITATTGTKGEVNTPNFSSGSSSMSTPTTKINFKFSDPLVVKELNTPTQNITPSNLDNYKFSPPLDVTLSMTPPSNPQTKKPQQPQLKSGSCLDVLNKPLASSTNSSVPTNQLKMSQQPLSANTFGDKYKKSTNEWECDTCMIRNKEELSKCVACETPRKLTTTTTASTVTPAISSSTMSFGQQFKKSSTEWECDTCMIRNKEENTKCVACETPRKGSVASSASSVSILPPIKQSFGDAFKPKSGTWECSTCLISNKSEANECIACQTKKPGSSTSSSATASSVAASSNFKFGFSAAQTSTPSTTADAGFKNIAAQQKASKWECDACMTRNDAERTKCACCEQPKPGAVAAETSSSSSTKFTFGATAAAKFSFGFGPTANAPKEDELRKDKDKTTATTVTPIVGKPNTTSTLPSSGFQFGIKPTSTEPKKDETDSKQPQSSLVAPSSSVLTGFKFGVPSDTTKKLEPTSTAATTTTTGSPGFTFGVKQSTVQSTTLNPASETTPTKLKNPVVSSPSVKFNLPTTLTTCSTSSSLSTTVVSAAPSFSFGSNTTSTNAGTFSFGSIPSPSSNDEKKSLEGFAFKTPAAVSSSTTSKIGSPATAGFVFGSQSASSTTITTSTTSSTSSSSASTTTAFVKPMFSFGTSNAAASTPSSTSAAVTTASGGFGSFAFGSSNAPATANKSLFGAVTSTTSTTTSASSNTSTKPATTTNLFGSFGGSTSATPTFGSSPATANPANNSTAVSSSTNSSNNSANTATPTFGTFGAGASANNTSVFGSFGGNNSSSQINQTQNKATPAPMFGSVASNSNSNSSSSSTQPASSSNAFVFGSAINTASKQPSISVTASTLGSSSGATSTTFGSKNTFVFGSSTTSQATPASPSLNKDAPKTSLFGTFGSAAASTNDSNPPSTSIFGNPTPLAATNNNTSPPSVFGSNSSNPISTTNSSTNLFSVSSAPAAPIANIFGANPSGSAATPAPAFGSSPFGGGGSASSATPTFGSTAVTGSTTFGGFGAATGNTSNTAVEVKKTEPAFNFGGAAQTTHSGGFNFGSTSAPSKPAFNFGSTGGTQPTFNFTGSTDSQNSAKPFQFGAVPSAPVFNFGGGAIETTPNAPFQFNAGAAPAVSSNIFAPTPTSGAQTAQQAKRKIRAPIRRVTQR
ncbi:nucleoporin 153 isoform X2 [Haematobia irritans]|uniref:nucleoporin 153 isoform X2 n=1 Tax=Haematobia irritans TaxID=7368 RepID=UPI003F507256